MGRRTLGRGGFLVDSRVFALGCALCTAPAPALAGAQIEEPLSASVQARLQRSVSDNASPDGAFSNESEARRWLSEMSHRLAKQYSDPGDRIKLLNTVHYEAKRAGLDPELVLGVIQVESGFRKYAVSTAGARGYMQVMPFWVKLIGSREHDLFHLRTNLRYGCTILRFYLDQEKGNMFQALGRYNGSMGQPEYPQMVLYAWKNFWSSRKDRADAADSTRPGVTGPRPGQVRVSAR